MRKGPPQIIHLRRHFELLFSKRMWDWVKILLVGAILAPGKRTVTACLRVMGLSQERQFQVYHRVLNPAKWSSRKLSRVLLKLLLQAFVPADAPVVLGIDEHLERRRGRKIAAKGRTAIYVDSSFDRPNHGLDRGQGSWYGRSTKTVRLCSGTALWYHSGLPPVSIRWVLITDPLGAFEPQALRCSDASLEAERIAAWFLLRWQLEVTFEEARAHLDIETQRQWSELAILRTTPDATPDN